VGGTCTGSGIACTASGTCGTCGGLGQVCCTGGGCSATGTVCSGGSCAACGGKDQPCCSGATCGAQLVCDSGSVCRCGGAGQPCCGGTTCSSPSLYCNGLCAALKSNGAACSAGTECSSTNCIDGYCCDKPCQGQCQACDVSGSAGVCTGVNGTPHRAASPARSLCTGSDPSCTGSCNASVSQTQCTFPPNTCRAQTCSNNLQINSATCDASGNCPAVTQVSCQYTCVGNACGGVCSPGSTRCNGNTPQTCDTTGTWQGTTACSGAKPDCSAATHLCVSRPQGEVCGSTSECVSGDTCVLKNDGTGKSVCCESACNGTCDTNTCTPGGACVHTPVSARKQCGMVMDTGNHNADYSDAILLLCDGQGGCAGPTFNCGTGGSCTLSASTACCNQTQQAQVTSCVARSSCYGSYGDVSETCKDTLDCPAGLICCKVEGAGFRGEFCEASCTDPSGTIPVVEQACDPARGGTCPVGQACAYDGDGVGEGVCN